MTLRALFPDGYVLQYFDSIISKKQREAEAARMPGTYYLVVACVPGLQHVAAAIFFFEVPLLNFFTPAFVPVFFVAAI